MAVAKKSDVHKHSRTGEETAAVLGSVHRAVGSSCD